MARTPLRAYNREIENLIDRGQIEEAIAHCKNIIKQFPKYIETYRLLGKCYLESQRYAEAADILTRVLSVFPDDFVSQLGMSIIREDEGNLDAAIWHMERAYEVQPFNRAVQDELRRLYGRRDGMEPPRIRLTRGALVRMYARGDLYPQAIAEIRAALAEDQTRLDMKALLARMYYLSGAKVEATEISSSLIGKLPYCFEANRILMEVLPETSHAEDARVFQQRIFALDPYAAFITPNAPVSQLVPEQTVQVERVEWQAGMEETQSPDWARTIGVAWDQTPGEELPDWLDQLDAPPPAPPVSPVTATPSSPDELIPDFMAGAGWQPSSGAGEEPLSFLSDETQEETEPVVEADIPDWLQSLAPAGIGMEPAAGEEDTPGKSDLDWVNQILPPTTDSTSPDVLSGGEVGAPLNLDDEAPIGPDLAWMSGPDLSDQPGEAEEVVPDWLSELKQPEAVQEETPTTDWLAGILSEETAEGSADALPIEAISQPETVTPDIAGVESPQIEAAEELSEPPAPVDAATPDWIAELAGEMEQAAPAEVQTELPTASLEESSEIAAPPEDMDAALAWMEALAARQGADAETLTISQPEERSETPPDWLQELSSPSTIEDTQPNRIAADSTIEQTVDAVSIDISPVDIVEPAIRETLPPEEQEDTPDQAEPAGPDLSDMDSALAWMEALAARQGADAETLAISKLEDRSETPPDWIRELALEEETPTQEVAETLAEIPTSSDSIFVEPAQAETMTVDQAEISGSVEAVDGEPQAEMDADAAFAWMEALAARQGAEEGTLITEPEARVEEPPQWIAESEEEIVPTAMDVVDISALDTTQEEPAPWADQIEPLVGEITEQPVDESQPVETWAPETEIIPELTTPDQEQIVASQDVPAVQEADIPSWLLSYEEETKTETRVPEATPEEMPTWLQEETPPIVIEPAADIPPTHDDAEPVMPEWLKALQDSQPATETSVPTPAWAPADTQPPATISASDEELIAQAALRSGDIEGAVKSFTRMIKSGSNLESVIKSIQDALDQHPINVDLWQTMGDAYMRANRIQDALDAYTKAEELLR